MAVIIQGCNPDYLLQQIYSSVSQNDIDTWLFDAEGDFTYLPPQWYCHAWLRPRRMLFASEPNKLVFGIVQSQKWRMTPSLYSVYHSRFVEMLLTHFDGKFQDVTITALLNKQYDILPKDYPHN